MQGRTVATQRIYYGQNTIDLRHLPAGIYAWILGDESTVVREGKVVRK
jgi:hypothetical protein